MSFTISFVRTATFFVNDLVVYIAFQARKDAFQLRALQLFPNQLYRILKRSLSVTVVFFNVWITSPKNWALNPDISGYRGEVAAIHLNIR